MDQPASKNDLSRASASREFEWERQGRRPSVQAVQQIVSPADLSVVFQPIVDMNTGAVFALEALTRCRVPEFKNPLTLFERAAQLNCNGRLGRMIREIAVPLCSGTPLFVNVHPSELSERWLIQPDDPVFSHDSDVYIEITESVPFSHFRLCMDVLVELRSRGGIHLVVDDLGAGFSNIKRIADLEPRVVKLDRELVREIHRSKRQLILVKSVVELCAALGAMVVAEGIETLEELDALGSTGVHYGQGYLFARPAFPIPEVHWPGHRGRSKP